MLFLSIFDCLPAGRKKDSAAGFSPFPGRVFLPGMFGFETFSCASQYGCILYEVFKILVLCRSRQKLFKSKSDAIPHKRDKCLYFDM